MFLQVTAVKYIEGYTLQVTFNNSVIKQVNLQDELDGEIFEPLKEIEVFKQLTVNPETNTIEWPNGADFAPEFLYEIGEMVQEHKEKRTPFPTRHPVPV